VPLAYLLAYMMRTTEYPNGKPDALFLSMLISWLTGALLSFIAYRRGKWKVKMESSISQAASGTLSA
jgi:Na+-driven multidrug efflux pump